VRCLRLVASGGRLHFVIAIEIGATMTVDDVTEDEIRSVLARLGLKNQPTGSTPTGSVP
jgi:hypothetical protein